MATSPGAACSGYIQCLYASEARSSWIASAKISERQPAAAQGVAQLQRMGPRGVVRVEGGDELVHGHRPPGGGAHRSVGGYGEVMAARTATTRKSAPPAPGG